jgi:hypothetical protein
MKNLNSLNEDKSTMQVSASEVMWVSHASLLLKKNDHFILTDPWDQQPAFGNLLPSLPMSMHPAYLAALKDKLTLVISHDHDDHCDDQLLQIFDKNTRIILPEFQCETLYQRLVAHGFTHISRLGSVGMRLECGVHVKAHVRMNPVHEDAIFTFDMQDGFVIHANDHWFAWAPETLEAVKSDIAHYQSEQVTLWGQAHSATGYPLNTPQLNREQKRAQVLKTAQTMFKQELETAAALGVSRYVSYAGFISPYVPGEDDYRKLVLVPTAKQMTQYVPHDDAMLALREQVKVLDIYPQDVMVVATGEIRRSFLSGQHYTDEAAQEATARYYDVYQVSERAQQKDKTFAFCAEASEHWLKQWAQFMNGQDKSKWPSVQQQSFALVLKDKPEAWLLESGQIKPYTKGMPVDVKLEVASAPWMRVVEKDMSFENLYTGFMGLWSFSKPQPEHQPMISLLMIFAHQYLHNQ